MSLRDLLCRERERHVRLRVPDPSLRIQLAGDGGEILLEPGAEWVFHIPHKVRTRLVDVDVEVRRAFVWDGYVLRETTSLDPIPLDPDADPPTS